MEALLGVIVGGVISIVTAWLTARWSAQREETAERRKRRDEYIAELSNLYEDVLYDLRIAKQALKAHEEYHPIVLRYYRSLIKMNLKSTEEIARVAIGQMSRALLVSGIDIMDKNVDDEEFRAILADIKQYSDCLTVAEEEIERLTRLMREHIESSLCVTMSETTLPYNLV